MKPGPEYSHNDATSMAGKGLSRKQRKKRLPLLIHFTHLGHHCLSGQALVSSFLGMKAKSASGSHSKQL